MTFIAARPVLAVTMCIGTRLRWSLRQRRRRSLWQRRRRSLRQRRRRSLRQRRRRRRQRRRRRRRQWWRRKTVHPFVLARRVWRAGEFYIVVVVVVVFTTTTRVAGGAWHARRRLQITPRGAVDFGTRGSRTALLRCPARAALAGVRPRILALTCGERAAGRVAPTRTVERCVDH